MTTIIFSTIKQAQQYAENLELQYERHLNHIICYDDSGEISHVLKFKKMVSLNSSVAASQLSC
jgi:hypothetical protein